MDARRGIHVLGFPGDIGGANTQLWHTLRLWREHGLPVTLLCLSDPPSHWLARVADLGVVTVRLNELDQLSDLSELRGGSVVAFCNAKFPIAAPRLRSLGCRLIWVNCMTWLFSEEIAFYREHGPFDAYMFQSRFQYQTLKSALRLYGVLPSQCFLIRGAFYVDEFPYTPRRRDVESDFVFGRHARSSPSKWPTDLWATYDAVDAPNKQVRVMGWDDQVEKKCGTAPPWAETLAVNAEDARTFLSSLHVLVPINGGAWENWPRVGLEAMASGVPVVTEREWGWREMVQHDVSGFLANDRNSLADYVSRLARDDDLRLQLAEQARSRVESFCEPERLWNEWKMLFDFVDRR